MIEQVDWETPKCPHEAEERATLLERTRSLDPTWTASGAMAVRIRQLTPADTARCVELGLLAFDGNRIEVLPLAEDAVTDGSVNVEQHIYGNAPQPYVVYYKLKQSRDGEWKLRNVSIEGVNLGRTYQSQFSSAVRRHNGDIDKVIENWEVSPEVAVGDESDDA